MKHCKKKSPTNVPSKCVHFDQLELIVFTLLKITINIDNSNELNDTYIELISFFFVCLFVNYTR